MQKIATKLRQIRYFLKKDVLTRNNVTIILAVIIFIVWTINTISAINRNWTLADKVRDRQLETAELEIEVDTLKLEQQYYQTEEYQELIARAKLGKKLNGETMVILPNNSEKAINKHKGSFDEKSSKYQSNFSKWLNYLFD